ncbi:MAG TPA: mechanosensitive ion channel family protein [Streptosporangiaceae bacterium]
MSILALLASTPTPAPSGSPTITDWGNQLQERVRETQGVADNMRSACGSNDPGVLCRLTFDMTHDGGTARFVRDFLDAPLKVIGAILFVVVLAWIIRRFTHRLIDRMVVRAGESTVPERLRRRNRAAAHEGALALMSERRRQRAQTTGSVLRSVATVVVFGIAAMMILQDLGMDLTPVLASAGIVGVAVGFGAQNLVKDYMSGIFMLLEDQYGVGDTIDIGEATGVVETVTLRTTRLRDADGVVWYVRNGEVKRVGNESQGWSRAVVDLPVSYEADIDRISALLRETAAEMAGDEEWKKRLTSEPDVWGVQAMSGTAVVMRVVVKTTSGDQGAVARELRRRAKAALDAEGVELARVDLTATDLK